MNSPAKEQLKLTGNRGESQMNSRKPVRRLVTLCLFAVVFLSVGIGVAHAAPSSAARQAYPSFYAHIGVPLYLSYSGLISVSTYASFRDYQCYPSYQCDQNVIVQLELRNGVGSFGRLVGLTTGQTGQYGSSVRATFRVPACRYIPKGRTVTYTVLMRAVAPNGDVKTDQGYVYARSCQY
jgi:hypothetical protein